ncbi:MAG: Gfo/Idh/MocA family oxidoreductase [bacterium]
MADAGPVGFGIIGCGGIAGTHAAALARVPGARIVAVADEVEAKARTLGEKLKVPWFGNRADLLALPEVEAVSLATPSGLHGPLGIEAARAGKHVITEKPVEVTVEKADALIAACRAAGVRLSMISQYRFHEGMRAIRAAAVAGRFGRLTLGLASTKWYRAPEYFLNAAWRGTWALDGGGSLMNQGIHALDQLLWVMGPVRKVMGYAATLFQKIETEDATAGIIEFASGALGVVETATCACPGLPARLEVMGDAGSVAWELGGGAFRLWECRDGTPAPALPVDAPWETYHARQFEDFTAAIREGREPLVNGEEGRRAVETICALYRSARDGRPVLLG